MKSRKILKSITERKGQVAVLIDPEKANSSDRLMEIAKRASFAKVDYFFVGGSTVTPDQMEKTVTALKENASIPVVVFPGDYQQVTEKADGLLYLSLLSGRNPEYLIGQHVASARQVFELKDVEVIPTAYILIDGGKPSSVAYVSHTSPIPADKINIGVNTALAGLLQGKSIVFFDAGSGAQKPVPSKLIKELNMLQPDAPIIVGGGIRSIDEIETYKNAGANVVVIGNHIEEHIDFLLELNNYAKEN